MANLKNPARLAIVVAAALLALLIVSRVLVGFYTEALWYGQLGHASAFWTRLGTEALVRTAAIVLTSAVVLANLWLVTRHLGPVHVRRRYGNLEISEQIPRKHVITGIVLAALLAGWWLSGVKFGGERSLAVLNWLRQSSFGMSDPLFGRDLSFYVFTLPVYFQAVELMLLVALWTLVLCVAGYALVGAVRWRGNRLQIDYTPSLHVVLLVATLLVLLGVRFWLGRYNILLEGTGFNDGVGYTDVHARLPAERIIALLCIATGAALVYSVLRQSWVPALLSAALLLLAGIGAGYLYPGFVQRFRVDPNEFRFEEPYIRWNIDFTRRAFAIDDVETRPYPFQPPDLSTRELMAELEDVPVWDAEPLRVALQQRQSLYPYYHFYDVDFDRYPSENGPAQVAVSVREFLPTGVSESSRTWQNIHFDPNYIRGVGAVVTPATFVRAGEPTLWLKDNPVQRDPRAPASLRLDEPSVFFGETMTDYIIARRSARVPIPATAIPLSSQVRVAAFAWRFADKNLLFTGGLTNDAFLAFRRRIEERVRALAPFLLWDNDPFPVLYNGRIYWLIDGYSYSNAFPIAHSIIVEDAGTVRYLRNSIKASVDALSGEVKLYRFDVEDPLLATYARAFPRLFTPFDSMPAGLRQHIRYPQMYLREQAEVLGHYHLRNADAFYRGEDVWTLPPSTENGADGLSFSPLYQSMQLPGEAQTEYVLWAPYIARQRQFMTALLVARHEPQDYGRLLMLELPRTQLVAGPRQIQAMVESDATIAQQISLLRQAGRVLTIGRVRIVPVDSGFIYVVPLFLSAEGSPIPELQRIVVSDGTRVEMGTTLQDAVGRLYGGAAVAPQSRQAVTEPSLTPQPNWSARALDLLDQAESALRTGDYATFGARLAELRRYLQSQRD